VQRNEEGFILVTVLLVIAVLFPLILAFNSKVELNLIQAENFRNSVQALRSARSGVEGAIGLLKADDPSYDSKRDNWAAAFPTLALGDGVLVVTVVDEDSKIPVNNLVGGVKNVQASTTAATSTTGQANTAAATTAANKTAATTKDNTVNDKVDTNLDTRLRALITRLGGKPEVLDALIDWLDSNSDVTGSEGAEDDYYMQLGYHCKNGSLDSLDELSLVRGFDKELLNETNLKDYLTIAPTDGKINLNTAPPEVLYAVLETKTTDLPQPLNDSDVQNLIGYRDQHDLKTLNDVASAIKIGQDQVANITPLVKVNSAYFTVNSRYTIGRVVKNVEALLKRDGSTVTIISWREF
jgi:general secretion pathway protein K